MKPSTGMWEIFGELKHCVHLLQEMMQSDASPDMFEIQERQIRAYLDGFRAEIGYAVKRQR